MEVEGNSLPYSEEGLRAAAATREALQEACKKRKEAPGGQPAKRPSRPPPTCSHEVARPEGFKDDSIDLDEAVHGEDRGSSGCMRRRRAANAARAARSAGAACAPRACAPLAKRRAAHRPHTHGAVMVRAAGTLDAPAFRGEMAKQYPFTLDPFQQTSIACLVRRRSLQRCR